MGTLDIHGSRIDGRGQQHSNVYRPADGSLLGQVPVFDIDQARQAVVRARKAQKLWAKTPVSRRRDMVQNFIEQLFVHRTEVAELLRDESGKTLYESYLFEIVPVIHLAGTYARRAERLLQPRKIGLSMFKNRASTLHRQPRGVVLVISPWNFPMSIPMGTVIMALLAGNAVVVKPSSLTPLIMNRMRDLFDIAGLDPDLFQVISGPGRLASQIIDEVGVDYVNFTGSTDTGRRVAQLAAANLTPFSMELGGKDPAIVTPQADVEAAARSIVWGAFANSGQVCASVERVYVHQSIHDVFVEAVVRHTKDLRQGNTADGPHMDVGCMTDPNQIAVLQQQVDDALARGARVLTGGSATGTGNAYYQPTVLVDVDDHMEVAVEESFGPLLPIMRYSELSDAIARANASRYGLNAYVYTKDPKEGRRIASQLEAGTVMINDSLMTHAFPETPWGGIKHSGMGRVHGDEGFLDLTEIRHVNHDTIAIGNPVWFPYSQSKINRFVAAAELVHRRRGILGKLRALGAIITGL